MEGRDERWAVLVSINEEAGAQGDGEASSTQDCPLPVLSLSGQHHKWYLANVF